MSHKPNMSATNYGYCIELGLGIICALQNNQQKCFTQYETPDRGGPVPTVKMSKSLMSNVKAKMPISKFQYQCQNFKKFQCPCQNFKADNKCQYFTRANVKCHILAYQGRNMFSCDSICLQNVNIWCTEHMVSLFGDALYQVFLWLKRTSHQNSLGI